MCEGTNVPYCSLLLSWTKWHPVGPVRLLSALCAYKPSSAIFTARIIAAALSKLS